MPNQFIKLFDYKALKSPTIIVPKTLVYQAPTTNQKVPIAPATAPLLP